MFQRSRSTFRLDDLQKTSSPSQTQKSTSKDCRFSIHNSANPVGLRILIEKSRWDSNVVNRSMLQPCRSGPRTRRLPEPWPELSFLHTCFLCKNSLSLEKDVYIYRGDRGFCSLECRYRQILKDERREIRGMAVERALPPSSYRVDHRHRECGRRRRIPAAA